MNKSKYKEIIDFINSKEINDNEKSRIIEFIISLLPENEIEKLQ